MRVRCRGEQELYLRDVSPREAASVAVDNSDFDRPRGIPGGVG